MIDIKFLRKNIIEIAQKLLNRNYILNIQKFHQLEEERVSLQAKTQELQFLRNKISKDIGTLKKQEKNYDSELKKVSSMIDKLKEYDRGLKKVKSKLKEFLMDIPNIAFDDVPLGFKDSDNKEIRKWGEPKKYNFSVKDHIFLGRKNNGMDFERATKIAGSRFVVMKGAIAHLHRALVQFMIDVHVLEHDYTELYVPYLVNNNSLYGTGQLPKFSNDLFNLNHENYSLSLIPTAEVPGTNFFRDSILSLQELPSKFVIHTPCFRKEAGSYGKNNKGLIRQHQFEKVELIQIVHPDNGLTSLEKITSDAENILKKLNLPYRVSQLCTGNINFSSSKTYDLEVWFPSKNSYCEISSCSWCGDFQARRMNTRFKSKIISGKAKFVHTLNGSGLAVGRTLAAVLENYQQEDGSIIIPDILKRYMGGLSTIKSF